MFVYVIVNSETLKIYIGQHKGNVLQKYLQQKISHALRGESKRSHLYNAMRKYPKEVWSIHPLISDLPIRVECDHWEKFLIRALNSQHPDVGYNLRAGGEGFAGTHTEETKKKLRQIIANRDPEVQKELNRRRGEKLKIIMLGNTHGRGSKGQKRGPLSEATKEKLRIASTGRIKSPEECRKIGEGHKGRVYNLGNTWNIGRRQSQETIEKRKASNAGFRHSEEAKQKMRHPKSEETIRRMIENHHAKKITHCPKGHELIKGNLVLSRLPHRICLECTRIRIRRHYWKHKKESQ